MFLSSQTQNKVLVKWCNEEGIEFNRNWMFTVGRFTRWLEKKGITSRYVQKRNGGGFILMTFPNTEAVTWFKLRYSEEVGKVRVRLE